MKRKLAEEHNQSIIDNEVPMEAGQYVTDTSIPEQFNPSTNTNLAPVFDKNNFVQLDELPVNETLMGKGYPEQWKNFATQDSSTMTENKKSSGRKKGIVSNYPMSDRTYERNRKDESASVELTQANLNNSNINRRIADGTVVESYQISALDRTNTHSNNNSANSKHSKSGASYDLRPITDRNFQEQFHRKPKKGELRETNTSSGTPTKENRSNGGQSVPPSVSDKYFEVRYCEFMFWFENTINL